MAIAISGCSLYWGTPATLGWPSGDPDDYAFWQSNNCFVYDKTVSIDMAVAIVGAVITIVGVGLHEDGRATGKPLAIGAGVVTAPFAFSSVAGSLGRSRCTRWARQIPIGFGGVAPTAGSEGSGAGSGAVGEPDGPPASP